MPDERRHRGAHPDDAELFAAAHWPALRAAVGELSWLLSRGYASPSAVKVVGDRHDLTARQRTCVMRSACTDDALRTRCAKLAVAEELADAALLVDGYNVLTTVEAALGGGVLMIGRDGALRDMASIHGTYRKVEETVPALELTRRTLLELRVARVVWYLDQPVSNSGRLRAIIEEVARGEELPWRVEIVPNPDAILGGASEIVATADSVILDACASWFNLADEVMTRHVPDARPIDLRDAVPSPDTPGEG